jgi:hypothetical protein
MDFPPKICNRSRGISLCYNAKQVRKSTLACFFLENPMLFNNPSRFFLVFTALSCMILSHKAEAQTADFSRGTCAQLAEMKGEERNQFLLWLHGYYAGAASRPVLDKGRLEQSISAFNQACEKNPSQPLIGIDTRGVMLGEASAPVTQPTNNSQPPAIQPGAQNQNQPPSQGINSGRPSPIR